MGKVLDEKCLNCGASIKFDSKKHKFICEYCNGEFTIDEINLHKQKINESSLNREFSLMEDMEGYQCNNCGAEIISLKNISSTTCIYCKSSAIIKNRLTGIYKPDSIIPFKFKKEDAINKFKEICKGRPLLPKKFNDINNITEMEGLYVPFWLYDLTNDSYIDATCTNKSTWMDSRYVYTKTTIYYVERGGLLSFQSVPNDAATRFDDKIMNAIEPFNYNDLKDFNTSYLAGYLSEKYDVSNSDAYKNCENRINKDSTNCLMKEIRGYQSINIKNTKNSIKINQTKYVLLPVFVLNIKYNDKIYHFAMNGQTGKLVGEIPVDKKKLILSIIITFGLSIFLVLIVFRFLGYRW